jgi:hypothetical protein
MIHRIGLRPVIHRAAWTAVAGLALAGGPGEAPAPRPPGGEAPPPDVGELRDITGIEPLPGGGTPGRWPWLAGAVLLGTLLVAAGWYRRRRRPAPAELPDRWALAELERITAPGDGGPDAERYHALLGDIVRRFLELRFGLPASRRTSPEFLRSPAAVAALSREQQRALQALLERFDLAKFARAPFSAEDCAATAVLARAFIESAAGEPNLPRTRPPVGGGGANAVAIAVRIPQDGTGGAGQGGAFRPSGPPDAANGPGDA